MNYRSWTALTPSDTTEYGTGSNRAFDALCYGASGGTLALEDANGNTISINLPAPGIYAFSAKKVLATGTSLGATLYALYGEP